ncbi:hypothetical protein A3F03_00550 [Candidatus Roizmanbacteria bacterium RIFCSPHIGHO2_12_FULL_41_11]|uniref:Cohesin domain-containing protein n=1 Tax=Candidatus Roizmanbacteria bacterium RIFCSPHIGHO2_12_FULL_41_11 TaxID=1802052 RepID=A0A1F7I5E2_9BACT|nr:MAG: hypothetical protein A3F03_00550 [Candidatus Roizmanbacteria bacterium RIFCSPHIGHO2_12_FULL_41_11]
MEPQEQSMFSGMRFLYRMIVVTFLVLLVGLVSFFFFKSSLITSKTNPDGSAIQPSVGAATPKFFTPTPIINNSSLTVEVGGGGKTFKTGQTINLQIKGSSDGLEIDGYDILLGYDPQAIEIGKISSNLSAFQIFQFKNKNYLTVTSIKRLNSQENTILHNTVLVKFTAVAKKRGTLKLEILKSARRESTKFVDKLVRVVVPKLIPLAVEIQ